MYRKAKEFEHLKFSDFITKVFLAVWNLHLHCVICWVHTEVLVPIWPGCNIWKVKIHLFCHKNQRTKDILSDRESPKTHQPCNAFSHCSSVISLKRTPLTCICPETPSQAPKKWTISKGSNSLFLLFHIWKWPGKHGNHQLSLGTASLDHHSLGFQGTKSYGLTWVWYQVVQMDLDCYRCFRLCIVPLGSRTSNKTRTFKLKITKLQVPTSLIVINVVKF